jgi:hypothetical protein
VRAVARDPDGAARRRRQPSARRVPSPPTT